MDFEQERLARKFNTIILHPSGELTQDVLAATTDSHDNSLIQPGKGRVMQAREA